MLMSECSAASERWPVSVEKPAPNTGAQASRRGNVRPREETHPSTHGISLKEMLLPDIAWQDACARQGMSR